MRRKIFRKTNFCYPLTCTRTIKFQTVKIWSFTKNFFLCTKWMIRKIIFKFHQMKILVSWTKRLTAWRLPKCKIFLFGIFLYSDWIFRKYRSEKNSILGHVSRSKSFGRELFFQKAFLYMFDKDLHTSNPLHKKWSFLLKVSSVRVTKSTGNCGFSNFYWINP